MSEHPEPSRRRAPSSAATIGIGALILIMGAAIAGWRLTAHPSSEPRPAALLPAPSAAVAEAVPLPPPPPPPPPAELVEPDPSASAQHRAPQPQRRRRRADPCAGPCGGRETGPLLSALASKGGQVRSCYSQALQTNPSLRGRMTVRVRVGATGQVCQASLGQNTVGDQKVSSCVLQRFRAGSFPPPLGGCVDAEVPLNFVSGSK
jgi:hypothetical protein